MPRILSVEDDADLQHLMSLALQHEGYEVHYAFTGVEGYEKVLSLNPDLILLDMMLPLMNGLEVIKRIKAHKTARDIPIVVMTAYYNEASLLETSVKALGVVEYIRKPVKLDELIRLIRRVLGDARDRTPISLKLKKGAVRIDPKFRTVWINNRLVATLAPKRFEVLYRLVQSKGEVPREELLKLVWSKDESENTLEKTVQRLREDLGPEEANRIRTTPVGYELIG
jgi:DNA-binding response OmpR family regulator